MIGLASGRQLAMLVLKRAVGQSLVVGEDWLLTLAHVEKGVAQVNLARLQNQDQVNAIALPQAQRVEVLPDVHVMFVEPLSDCAGARLGLEMPRDLSIHRKEVFDAMQGEV
jgi:sRNA-binding carbon storage regulator CsrA